ncbi:MAG: alcohol dehydrogenase catalytic domain-containing protein [Actinobacteria bacterium]|nr:alcohol dehydrogenase catalytic domain-containing protein [Actinomycetota bacterium]
MALSLELFRSVPRYLGARAIGSKAPGLVAGPLAPLRLATLKDPVAPKGRPGWARVRPLLSGICGSDLATIGGRSSFYFSPLVSLPFVPGHEVVGELVDACDDLAAGTRVVLASVLACAARGEDPPCSNCAAGDFGRCDRVTVGHLKAGLQTGYCADTGGGWSRMMLAHRSQLHEVPQFMSDEVAVLVEPFACAIHAALRANVPPGGSVLVVGAGTVGVLTTAALRMLTKAERVIVAAKHPKQRGAAKLVGASEVVKPEEAVGAVRRGARAVKLKPERGSEFLLGGVDVALECTGSRAGLDLALRTTRAGGRVVLSGIPDGGADLTPLWFRELELVGAYTSGTERLADGAERRTFDMALEMASGAPMLGELVGARYPLDRWREAIDHALSAGRLGTFKVAFAPQDS